MKLTDAADLMASKKLSTQVLERLDSRNSVYLNRRQLKDGAQNTYLVYVTQQADAVMDELSEADASSFPAVVESCIEDASVLSLNTAALMALRQSDWPMARKLAGEVVARDHHDLMAQRLIDAADENITMLETAASRWLRTRFCEAPFRQMETRVNGTVHFCCSAWQPSPIGRFDAGEGPNSYWNSDTAHEIRRSVNEGDFTHCSHWHCPAIAARRLPKALDQNRDVHVSRGPKRVILSHDRSCNISCPSCRTKRILLEHTKSSRLDDLFRTALLPLLDESEQIKVTGSGDPLGSRHFRNVLRDLCVEPSEARRIQLHTNGLLANEQNWDKLNLWGHVSSVWVSVDAAKSDTYAKLRRDGEFEQLLGCLKFLGQLRQSQAIDSFRLDFVVQSDNYDQMGDFVDLAQRVGASHVYFLRLRNWGHIDPQDFRKQDICDASHTDHSVFLDHLKDPRLKQAIVDLGSVGSVPNVSGETNYYE
jgi:molybdenum cofactor biosynthesis enzyme MoaA